jgi:pyrroline-5-carboxylate reductase
MANALDGKRIGFIGGGAMTTALVGGLRSAEVAAEQIVVGEPDPARRKAIETLHGIHATADNTAVVADRDVVVVAVKPAVAVPALKALAASLDASALTRPLWISIAAGVPLAALESALPEAARVVRVMPNTPAQAGAGAAALCPNARTGPEDRAIARALFRAVGIEWECPSESLLDAVTGLSGSGPAYVFVFLEALADAGVRVGLPREAALRLAAQTVYGAAKLVIDSGQHPAVLKDQVASPGGTTIAGLERLEAGGLRAAVYEAVAAATRRSRELGQE